MTRIVFASLAVATAVTLAAFAGEPLRLSSSTIDGGGVMRSTSDDGLFVLSGTIGQPDAGTMEGGDFKLTGGFWFETPAGDCNSNGFLELADHAGFAACMSGPAVSATGDCLCFETSGDGAVDLIDFREAQNGFFGD